MFDIPELDLGRQVVGLGDWKYLAWGGRSRSGLVGPRGCYHFYVDDGRFSRLWRVPGQLLETRVRRVCEVNWSVWDGTSEAEAIWGVYRKRWLSRYWQDVGGVDVVVDLNVGRRWWGLNLEGVPDGWGSYCTRGYESRVGELEWEYELACGRAGGGVDVEFLVYGGGRRVRELSERRGWVWVEDHMTELGRERMRWRREQELGGVRAGLAVRRVEGGS